MSALPTVRSRQDALALLEQGKALIAAARDVADLTLLRSQAAAVRHYLRQQRFAFEAVMDAKVAATRLAKAMPEESP
jgi:hypothetical protein